MSMSKRSQQTQHMTYFGLNNAVILGTPTFRTVQPGAVYETFDRRNTVTNINSGNLEDNYIEGSFNTKTVTYPGQDGRSGTPPNPSRSQTPKSNPYGNGPVTSVDIGSFNMEGNDIRDVLGKQKRIVGGASRTSRVEVNAGPGDVHQLPEDILRAALAPVFEMLGHPGLLPPTSTGGTQPQFNNGPIFEDVRAGGARHEVLEGTAVTNFGSFNVRNNGIYDSMNTRQTEYYPDSGSMQDKDGRELDKEAHV